MTRAALIRANLCGDSSVFIRLNMPVTILFIARAAIIFIVSCNVVLAFQVVDDRGITVTFAAPPQRIVSVLPSLTESVCALGQCQRLVGVDRYSNWPESVKRLPQVGGGIDPNIEAIVALRPDVVLMAASARGAARLEALGIKVLTLEPQSHADVRRALEVIGELLGVQTASQVWREMDAGVQAAAQSLPQSVKRTRVYFEVNNAPYGAGESSFMGETLNRLGVQNILPANLGAFPKINPEFVVRANPDVIMVSVRDARGLVDRPGWRAIRAVRERRVCAFSAEEDDVLVRPGPRMADAARLMAQCLAAKVKAP